MPYKLRKAPKKELYWVVNKETGKKHSKEPLPRKRAEAQMRALYAVESGYTLRGKGEESESDEEIEIDDTPRFFDDVVRGGFAGITPGNALLGIIPAVAFGVPMAMMLNSARKAPKLFGSGAIPSKDLLQQIATASYSDTPPSTIGNFQLIRATPTLKFYSEKNGNTMIVGIRGTKPTDPQDVKADALIGVGQLASSDRYKKDLQDLQQFQLAYSPSQYDYYGVGHSLGGAILDMFLKLGLLKSGISYNPAIQIGDFQADIPNTRIYQEGDPLYELMGKHAKVAEVRPAKKRGFFDSLVSKIPYAGKAYQLYKNHALDNFVGGKISNKFLTQLKEAGVSAEAYLKEARRRAKAHGYSPEDLDFSSDGVSKLVMKTDSGRFVRFGRVGYGDHLLWTALEASGKAPKGKAAQKQRTFQKSHSAIKGDWKSDKFSKNNLALKILW